MANFHKDMMVADAMAIHPRAQEVFAGFHLGGCSSCQISHEETIEQVCFAYGVEVELLLESLEGLMDIPPAESTEQTA